MTTSKNRLLASAALVLGVALLGFAPAPAKAQVADESLTLNVQVGGALTQAANAASYATSAANNAGATSAAVNMIHNSDITHDVDINSVHIGAFGAVSVAAGSANVQIGAVGAQAANAISAANAQLQATADSTAANIVGNSTQSLSVKVNTKAN